MWSPYRKHFISLINITPFITHNEYSLASLWPEIITVFLIWFYDDRKKLNVVYGRLEGLKCKFGFWLFKVVFRWFGFLELLRLFGGKLVGKILQKIDSKNSIKMKKPTKTSHQKNPKNFTRTQRPIEITIQLLIPLISHRIPSHQKNSRKFNNFLSSPKKSASTGRTRIH